MAETKERRRTERTKGFAAYVETFSEGYLETDWGKSWKQAKRQLELHAIPKLADRPLPEIGVSHIHEVLDGLRGKPGLQRSVWAVLSSLFRWAEKRDDIEKTLWPKLIHLQARRQGSEFCRPTSW